MRISLTKVLPRHPQRDERSQLVWDVLVPRSIHPVSAAIVEALLWIDLPLAPSDVGEILRGEFSLSLVSYHMLKLAEAGTLAQVGTQKVYFFPDQPSRSSAASLTLV